MGKLWDKLNSEERQNIICRYLETEPGKHCSCLARDFDTYAGSINFYIRKLFYAGKITKQPQKMRLQEHQACKVNRLYVGVDPKIDYDKNIFDPQGTACSTMWYLLSAEEKRNVILRELRNKPRGLSLSGLSKRIGVELSLARTWIKRMESDGAVKCENGFIIGIEHEASNSVFSNISRGISFEYTKDGWQKVEA